MKLDKSRLNGTHPTVMTWAKTQLIYTVILLPIDASKLNITGKIGTVVMVIHYD